MRTIKLWWNNSICCRVIKLINIFDLLIIICAIIFTNGLYQNQKKINQNTKINKLAIKDNKNQIETNDQVKFKKLLDDLETAIIKYKK